MKRGMSGIITTVIIIGIALAAIGIIWFVINTVVNEQVSSVENKSSKVFQSCKDVGYYKMNTGDTCQGVISYLGGEKCCQSGLVVNYGLISYWSFDVDARDDWGDNNGTANGATWNSTGGFNGKGSYKFDGVNDYIETSAFSIPNTEGVISVAFWYKGPSGLSYQTFFGDGEQAICDTGGNFWWIYRDSGFSNQIVWQYCNGISGYHTDIRSPSNFLNSCTNNWCHVVLALDYNNKKLSSYLNGTSQGEDTTVYNMSYYSANRVKYFGAYSTSAHRLNGTLDEVRIYNRALSADDVRALYELT